MAGEAASTANQGLRAARNPGSKRVRDWSGKTASLPAPADTSQLAPLREDQQGGRAREPRAAGDRGSILHTV